MMITWGVLAQTEAPEPMLPDRSGDFWGIALWAVIVLLVAFVAWRVWRYIRDTRRTADQALEAVSDLRRTTTSGES